MFSVRLLKAPARRALVASLAVVIALFIAAAPANAKPGNGGGGKRVSTAAAPVNSYATMTQSVWHAGNPCSFDAYYAWAGFNGQGFTVAMSLLDGAGNTVVTLPPVMNAPGSGDYTYILTFSGSGGPSRDLYARGVLLQNGVEVSGSSAVSPVVTTTCTGSIGVQWLNSFPLS